MTAIYKRTVYYDTTGGVVRFTGWATVVTAVGQCVEPFLPAFYPFDGAVENFDFKDDIGRIDEMQRVDVHKLNRILSGGEKSIALNGGIHNPRIGP